MSQITLEKFSVCEDVTSDEPFMTNSNSSKLHNQGCSRTWNRSYRIAATFLGLLCAALLAAIIMLYVENRRLQTSHEGLTEPKTEPFHTNALVTDGDQQQAKYTNLSLEKEQLENSFHQFQASYNSVVEERDLSRAITANVTEEKIQLQTLNSNLVKEKDQLQELSNNLRRERDQLKTRYKTMTDQRDQIQNELNNITDQLQTLKSHNDNLTKERDQLQNESAGLHKALSNFGWKYFRSSVYSVPTEKMNWTVGRQHCRKSNAELVVIKSQEEMVFVHSLISNLGAWLGLTDKENEGIWKWVDGVKLTTSYWMKGQPNNGGGNEDDDCGVMVFEKPALESWNDRPCHHYSYVICKKSVFN